MDQKTKGLITVHGAVLLFGLSGLFAKLITLPSIIITLGRVGFSSVFLFLLLRLTKTPMKLREKKQYGIFALSGVILAVHWWSFLQAIQFSTVAIGTISFSTFPLFVSFLDPLFTKNTIKKSQIISSLIMICGVVVMVEEWSFRSSYTLGIICGLISAVTYALLSLLNKHYFGEYPSTLISFYEQSFAFITLLPALFIIKPIFSPQNIALLALLGVIFTAISHSLFISGLKNINPHTASIISGLETPYSIVASYFIFGEVPSLNTVLGGCIILGVVFYTTLREKK